MSSSNSTQAQLEPDIDRAVQFIAVYVTMCAVTLMIMILRFTSRIMIQGLGWDDAVMAITWVLYASLTIIIGFLGSHGGTRHLYYLDIEQSLYVIKLTYVAEPFGIMAVATGKVAVGLLLLRIITQASKWRRYLLYGLMTITMILGSITAIITFTQCRVPRALWTPELRSTTYCWNPSVQSNFSIFVGSWYALVDFTLALMPVPVIWQLQLGVRNRIGLIVLLSCGVFSGVCASIKTAQLAALTALSDLTWETFSLFLWTAAEIFVMIVCGSIPTLKPLWDRLFRPNKGRTTMTSTRLYTSGHNTGEKYIKSASEENSSRSFELSRPGKDMGIAASSAGLGESRQNQRVQVTQTVDVEWN